jgi:hypothetical protein
MTSEPDPIESIAKGITKGFLELGAETIKDWIQKFKEKKISFVKDKENLKLVKEQYNSGELQIYKKYIEDKEKLMILRMGLILRKLEFLGEKERKQKLREDLIKKYKVKGLHIAQFVENGILNRYMGILLDDIESIENFKEKINDIIENIEKYVIFVKGDDKERFILEQALRITSDNLSMIFIVSGMGSAAELIKKLEERLIALLKEYELEKMSKRNKENLFFKRILKS